MAQEAYPLHFLVWNNQYLELDRELQKKEVREDVYFAGGRCLCICMRLVSCTALRWYFSRVGFRSRMPSAWIREGAPRWSWLCVWATWSQPECCSGTPQTPHTATHRAGPVSSLLWLFLLYGNKKHLLSLNEDLCFSLAGGSEHWGPWAGSAGASVQGFQACHWETGRHPRAAQQTETGKNSLLLYF